jgi:hypothetical protein
MSDGNLGQTRVLRACVATRPFRGLGFVEARTRGIHQGWKVAVLSEKAEYMSATEPQSVMTSNRLAKEGRSIYVATLHLMEIRLCFSPNREAAKQASDFRAEKSTKFVDVAL